MVENKVFMIEYFRFLKRKLRLLGIKMDFFTQTICGQIINGFKFDWSLHEMNQMVVLVTFVPEAESPQNHARISVLSDPPILSAIFATAVILSPLSVYTWLLKYLVRKIYFWTWFLNSIYFKLDFYCLCSLQKLVWNRLKIKF